MALAPIMTEAEAREEIVVASKINSRDISPTVVAAQKWLEICLIGDQSLFAPIPLWTPALIEELRHAFVEHPDLGEDDFMTKLKGQMSQASPAAQRLMAEMLWALLLFPSNMKSRTKRHQIREIWSMSGEPLPESAPLLADAILVGIGSGGPGFNNYRPDELAFLVELTGDLKKRAVAERREILSNYDRFVEWVDTVPQKGRRQYRHMLRYFAFPNYVERMSSNNDRCRILSVFRDLAPSVTKDWSDQQLDKALSELREELEQAAPAKVLDFYEPPLREKWHSTHTVKTIEGAVSVIVPGDEDDNESISPTELAPVRQSIQVQAKLAEIGAMMGFRVWIPPADRGHVLKLIKESNKAALIEELLLGYNKATVDTIQQIDVIWLKRQSIVRAFEVEHTTAVYSGLLRMADLLALQPNMSIRLHIVAPDERREKVFREMQRPVFTFLEAGPLSRTCSFISYESVDTIRDLEHLSHTNDGIIATYEERADEAEA